MVPVRHKTLRKRRKDRHCLILKIFPSVIIKDRMYEKVLKSEGAILHLSELGPTPKNRRSLLSYVVFITIHGRFRFSMCRCTESRSNLVNGDLRLVVQHSFGSGAFLLGFGGPEDRLTVVVKWSVPSLVSPKSRRSGFS